MADMNKAEKLAAARRKLKEYQKKNKDATTKSDSLKRAPKSTSNSGTKGPYEQSFVFDSGTGQSSPNELVSVSPVPAVPEPAGPSNGYCSSLSPPLSSTPAPHFAPTPSPPLVPPPVPAQSLFPSLGDSRDFFDNLPSHSAPVVVAEHVQSRAQEEESRETEEVTSEMPECDISAAEQRPADSLISSSTESLRQLSLQINGLMDDGLEASGSGHSELERRNQELAALLADRDQRIEQLHLQLKEYQSRTSQLQVDMGQLQAESETRLARELHPVQEQLQLHIQTVGILVGEKTELQAALGKSQQTAKQKAAEVEELQGRLKASRHRVTELEKELAALGGTREMLELGSAEQTREVERLRAENGLLKRQLDETEEEFSEVRHQLDTKSGECAALQQQLQERQSQISLLELKVQQLTTPDRPDVDQLLEAMHQQKVGLEWQVSELQQAVKSLGVDREQATQQYQDYLQQFNSQLKSMAEKLAATSAENEQLANREQSLVRHISELEKQLQQQQQRSQEGLRDTDRVRDLETAVARLEGSKQELTQQLNAQLQEKSALEGELEEAARRIKQLEWRMEALQSDQPDTDRLLAAMESDKVAAAQAVAQNVKLKTQLEELQDSFIKMSNDKMELTDHLQHEQHVSKELGERLTQQEGELQDMRNRLEQREKLIMDLQTHSKALSEEAASHGDHTGHLEELESLRQELGQAKAQIEMLTAQNQDLVALVSQQTELKESTTAAPVATDRKDELMAALSASVQQLEMERNQLHLELQQARQQTEPKDSVSVHQQTDRKDDMVAVLSASVQQLEKERDQLHMELRHARLQLSEPHVLPHPDVDPQNYISMKEAMEKLEERFTKTMQEVSELAEEKQNLEYTVQQLQGETETIGEYITIYQAQRCLMRQRAEEKEEQLTRLQRDREEMKRKLNELTNLVQSLVGGQGEQPQTESLVNGDVPSKTAEPEVPEVPPKSQAADKIMALLSEIGSSNLVVPQIKGAENFHPCPWCSGRLITI